MTTRPYDELGNYTSTGTLLVRENILGPGAPIVLVEGDPNGTPGNLGQLAVDQDTGTVYQNQGGTVWATFQRTPDSGYWAVSSDGVANFDGVATPAGSTLAAGVYTLTRDVFYTTATIAVGIRVRVAGYRLSALSLVVNGALDADGDNAAGANRGAAGAAGVLGGGLMGGNGGNQSAGAAGAGNVQAVPSLYASDASNLAVAGAKGLNGPLGRGAGGGGCVNPDVAGGPFAGANSGTLAVTAANGGGPVISSLLDGRSYPGGLQWLGGTGGGGGAAWAQAGSIASGGGGGAGGGFVVVLARSLSGAGRISANGGAGGAGGIIGASAASGGGGGGGGGTVVLVYGTRSGSVTVQAIGGVGGAGAATVGGAARAGYAGGDGGAGVVVLVNTSGDGT